MCCRYHPQLSLWECLSPPSTGVKDGGIFMRAMNSVKNGWAWINLFSRSCLDKVSCLLKTQNTRQALVVTSSRRQKWLCCGPFDQQLLWQPWPGFEIPWNFPELLSRSCISSGKCQALVLLSACPSKGKGGVSWRTSPLLCVLSPTCEAEGCAGCDGQFSEVNSS